MRKNIIIILFLVLPVFGLTQDKEPIRTGISKLVQKDYSEAIKLFKIAARTKKTPGVYYNLALSYWGNGNKGYAIYYFKKALVLYPFYTRAKIALSNITNTKEKKRLISKKILYYSFLSLYFLLNFYLLLSILKIIRFGKLLFAIGMIIFLIIIPVFLHYNILLKGNKAIIVERGKINLYAEPDDNSLKIYSLNEGDEITVISELGGWYQIKKGKTYFGWIKASNVKKL